MESNFLVSKQKSDNKVYNVKGYHHAIKVTRFLLHLLGGWPNPGSYWTTAHFALIVTTMFCFETASQTVIMAKNANDLNFLILIIVDCNVPATISIIKLSNVWYHRHILKSLVKEMIKDWKTPRDKRELDIMWKYSRMSRYCCIFFIIINKSAVVTQAISNFAKPIKFLKGSNETEPWPLYFYGSFPYNYKSHPNYELTLIGQFVSITCASLSYDSTDSFLCILLLHVIGQLAILKSRILDLNKCDGLSRNGNSFSKKFAEVHKMHIRLWRTSQAINESFSTMFLMQMIPSMLVLCTQGYLIILVIDNDKIAWGELVYLLYFLLLFILTLFAYCYIGEILRVSSMEINDAAYNCNWTSLPPKEAKLLIMLMNRAQNPFEITVGKFAIFSLNLYCNILKTSAGYLSVLLAVKDRVYEE